MEDNKIKKTILIVDDISDNIAVLDYILRSEYKIKVATNGKLALKIAMSQEPPDLILLDIIMPVMDGYEVCSKLKENKNTENIPVIFVTSKNEISDESKGFELGAVDYISKPVSPPIVKARVKTHLALSDQNRILEHNVVERTAELNSVMENTTNVICTLDLVGNFTFVNNQACNLTGYTKEELLGTPLYDLFEKSNSELIKKQLDNVVNKKIQITQYEIEISRKNNSIMLISLNLSPMMLKNETVGVVFVAEDITDRK